MTDDVFDLIGAGIGPFNLSLAAQFDAVPAVSVRFFDRRPAFDWHPGMMLPGVEMQTSILKDLVTATNPTSPWSFIAYLVRHKRFYQFINAEYEAVPRREFADYLGWVARGLSSLSFGVGVETVEAKDRLFSVMTSKGRSCARNLSVGVGKGASVPDWALALPKSLAFHSSEAAHRLGSVKARRVAVIGGGQSGAEIVDALLDLGTVDKVEWISRRPNFEPLDATPFTNELFTPGYMDRFHELPEELRLLHTKRQLLASDGVSASTLKKLYRRFYELRVAAEAGADNPLTLRPFRDVVGLERNGASVQLTMRNGFDRSSETVDADLIVLATGYRYVMPDFLAPLKERIAFNSLQEPVLRKDFSLEWDGPCENRIFLLNAGRHSHGIAEPQLSLAAWRSAVIANAVIGSNFFDLDQLDPVILWNETLPAMGFATPYGEAAE
ncbi:lysine N(6)-hydroxylase/L-ornithine N(5)-oxygenase family protein [Allorhizobium sp. BGMRC 0089]|uniref:lysine N(6)-hydroxylase/L-ornithine N(5)-oxygenase family protein n=1 Tax=Allorhizobium sonneratiae TaxID=2934936 RepID=UPI0020333CAD|nr:lysine N(6)-hydroxylase/L-ornithine N(5)-oxygenase family protein [Allorhizobium sonneratiae]MCM2293115.1 lysine N(6)-hydroxylase/L-ornithine N(5)-oxygenase family protein [Allorhizobium sonneratiae]